MTAILAETVAALIQKGKGLLAADESTSTIGKRLASIGLENTEENRRIYRTFLATTPDLGNYISGVILYEETLKQKSTEGSLIKTLFEKQGIVPGIKVDLGLVPLALTEEKITQGLDGLAERLRTYGEMGACFAKWRAVFDVSASLPSDKAIYANAESLARYAAICQSEGIVPIVEPEVLMDGAHDVARCEAVTTRVLECVFAALSRYGVVLEHMLLKPNMVVPGKLSGQSLSSADIATATLRTLRRTVPAAVPGILFLSGGQSPEEATANLQAMNAKGPQPWVLSFSYGRALQEPCLKAWAGQADHISSAQMALLNCAKNNSQAAIAK